MRLPRPIAGAALAVLALTAAGCGHRAHESRPPPHAASYEARHPIQFRQATRTATIEIGARSGNLGPVHAREIEGVARAFQAEGEGALSVGVPSGASNEVAATRAGREIAMALAAHGVPERAIVMRPYRADPAVAAPPVVLSYTHTRADVPHRCAVSTNLDMDFENEQWANFGCAAQRNMSAMAAHPNDLVTPRAQDRIDAARRYTVVERYRQGQDTATQVQNATGGAISQVGR
jgi:pilus assembly protein CpaD